MTQYLVWGLRFKNRTYLGLLGALNIGFRIQEASSLSFGLQIAQSRSYLHTLAPKVGTIYILGALGFGQKALSVARMARQEEAEREIGRQLSEAQQDRRLPDKSVAGDLV